LLLIIPLNAALAVTLVPCGLNGAADCTLCHLAVGIQNIFDFLLKLILAACILGITISGVFYMVSSGSKKLIEQAKKSFNYSITALVLLLCSWLIVNAVVNALGFELAGGWSKFKCDTTQTTGPKPSGPGPSGPKPSGPSGPPGQGCEKVVDEIKKMDGWTYTQDKPPKSPNRMDEGYGDCSSTTERAYQRAGCKSPGGSTGAMMGNAQPLGGYSPKAGDSLVWNNGTKGHVGICLNDGCSQIMGASTKNGIRPSSGSTMLDNPNINVIKAADLCGGC
jgi:hypothetical protein